MSEHCFEVLLDLENIGLLFMLQTVREKPSRATLMKIPTQLQDIRRRATE